MGNFSRDTFDEVKHYVGVRLQQGVPLVDADWNEAEDIRRYELRAFIKWFVGDGVPKGNDGFRILPASESNDFVIKGGDGSTDGAGRILVDGWEVVNERNLRYSQQPGLPPYVTPTVERTDTVFLDVWEREVTAAEDADLINMSIGLETCVRTKREWVTRVETGKTDPPTPVYGHVHYPLAHLMYALEANGSLKRTIVDLRRTGLAVLSKPVTIEGSKVGIGTTAPRERLQIGSDAGGGAVFHDGGNKALAWNAYLDWNPSPDQRGWKYMSDRSAAMLSINYESEMLSLLTAGKGKVGKSVLWRSGLSIDSAGKVGIGTADPQATLHVVGNAQMRHLNIVNDGWAYLDIRSTTAGHDAGIRLFDRWVPGVPDHQQKQYWSIHNDDDQDNALDIRFNNRKRVDLSTDGCLHVTGRHFSMYQKDLDTLHVEAGGQQDKFLHINPAGKHPGVKFSQNMARSFDVNNGQLHITSDGNVGIGTGKETPTGRLQIVAGTEYDVQPVRGGFLILGAEDGVNLALDSNEIMARKNGRAATLYIQNDGGNLVVNRSFTVTDSGKVGIGTQSPTDRVQIGDGYTKLAMGIVPVNASPATPYLGFNASRTSSGKWILDGDSAMNNGGVIIRGGAHGELTIATIPSQGDGKQELDDDLLRRYEAVRIVDGSVGIGDVVPGHFALDVGGAFSVTNPGLHWGGESVFTVDVNGNVRYFTSIEQMSSISYKRDVTRLSLTQALDVLQELKPITFRHRHIRDNQLHVGFIAEEVPELIASKSRQEYRPVEIISILTKVVQHQQQELEKLRKLLTEPQ